ncbi:UNVERIFIED_CONTAM: hypothetical protein FKN15_038154 [Acipenser sinensis]
MAEKEAWPTNMQGAVVTSSLHIKTNCFDGRGNCEAFQSVFEALALENQWSEAEKGGQLISAQSCILTLPTGERTKYISLAAAAEGAMETTGTPPQHSTRAEQQQENTPHKYKKPKAVKGACIFVAFVSDLF